MEGSDTSSGQLIKQQLDLIWPRNQKLRALPACQAPLWVSAPRGSGAAGLAGACSLLTLAALQGVSRTGARSETCSPH